MIALPRQITCQNIMAAAREQAWTNPQQVLGLPTRLGDEPRYTRHWDLTAIAEVLDQATALQWSPEELTAWVRDDLPHRFAIRRPGCHRDQAEVTSVTRSASVSQAVAEVCWEVETPDGTAIGRFADRDIDLADALYSLSPPGSHLVRVMATAGGLA